MASVNHGWPSFRGLDCHTDHAKKVGAVLERANFSHVCSKAVELRKRQRGCRFTENTLTCSVDKTKFISGAFNVVVALDFSDSSQWVL